MVFRMDVRTLEPGKQVILDCYGDHPEWAGTSSPSQWPLKMAKPCFSSITADGKRSLNSAPAGNSIWGNLMYRLKAYVEGGNPGPQWTE